MCVTECCRLYLAFSRNDWALNYSMWERGVWNCVIFLYQHKVSMKKCRGCESAADLVHFSFQCHQGHRAAVLRTPHPIVQSKRCGIKGPLQANSPSDTCAYESQQQCQQREQHASYGCLTHTTLSVGAQHKPENILTTATLNGTFLLWLHILAPCQIPGGMCCARSSQGGSRIGLMNHATWYCLIECTKSKLDSH